MPEFLQINSGSVAVSLFAGIIVIGLLFSFIIYFIFSYRHKQKDYQLLQTQKDKINSQNFELEKTLEELKSTQSQLLHRERMASLGELTAGIAHEIQNPLNFVNNFSEVNVELADELKVELGTGNYQGAISIVNDIKENAQKIHHHGRRADSIVKSMLQHSRSTSGEKIPTDLNALANEYLKLSYHGFKAKDNTFNPKLVTDFDNTIGEINIIPQEIGRVLINLYNNAFYAVAQIKKSATLNYEPTVKVTTKKLNKNIEIKVWDNGTGIPNEMKNKIFQPFFTTKPTGDGTGLGLSLSYETVEAHGGKLTVESELGIYTEFIIRLPI